MRITIADAVHDRNEIALAATGKPQVGIFYFIDKKLYWEGETPRILPVTNGIKDYFRIHMTWFYQTLVKYSVEADLESLVRKLDTPTLKRAWKYWPRGRVVCDETETQFVVYCDDHVVKNRVWRMKVMSEMNLPYAETEFVTDGLHYQCNDCKPAQFF